MSSTNRSTLRLYHISTKLKRSPDEIFDCARELGLQVANHLGAVSLEDAARIEQALAPEGERPKSVPSDVIDQSRFGLVEPAPTDSHEEHAAPPEAPAKKEVEAEEEPAPKEVEKPAPPEEKPAEPEPVRPDAIPQKPLPRKLVKKPATISGPLHTKRAEEAPAKTGYPASQEGGERGRMTRKTLRELERQRAREQQARRRPMRPNRPPVGRRRRSSGSSSNAPKIEMPKRVEMTPPITVKELSAAFGIKANQLIGKLFQTGVMVNINSVLTEEQAQMVALEFDREVIIKHEKTAEESLMESVGVAVEDEETLNTEETSPSESEEERPPVVAFLGHVDHGKTSLLDAIRQEDVVSTESGGITQHIGAYKVRTADGKVVTFLDTPGHKAFTEMRARGAHTTDIVVLVVAADDGVMPQTEEAIDHAKAAEVPIVVALNKVDKANANPDRVKQQLSTHDLIPEDWGGDTIVVPVSALKKQGIDDLLEMIALRAELEEYKADPSRRAQGTVLEARVSEGRGIVSHVLVQDGRLKVGDHFICGGTAGRVKAMFDDHGQSLKEAGPSTPVEVIGMDEVPEAGDQFYVVRQKDVKRAQQVAQARREKVRQAELAERQTVTLNNLFDRIAEGQTKEVRLIIKADVKGSLEVLRRELEDLATDDIKVRILRSAIGAVSESDVLLAQTSDAVIIGFHVISDDAARSAAEEKGVDIQIYHVIYDLLDDVKKAMEGLLEPIQREEITGHAQIRKVFTASGVGSIAGCYITDGTIHRSNMVRLVRDGIVIYTGKLQSLKRFQDDVKEVRESYECGIKIDGYEDIKVEDVIEAYQLIEEKQTL